MESMQKALERRIALSSKPRYHIDKKTKKKTILPLARDQQEEIARHTAMYKESMTYVLKAEYVWKTLKEKYKGRFQNLSHFSDKFLFLFSCHLFDNIFPFARVTSCRALFAIDEVDRSSHTSVLCSLFIMIMLLYTALKISGDTCIERIICTSEDVGKVGGHYIFRLRCLRSLVNPLLISQSFPVASLRKSRSASLALPSTALALSRIFTVPSGSVSIYSSFFDPGESFILSELDESDGKTCIEVIYSISGNCNKQRNEQISLY